MTPQQMQGLWICLTISLAVAAICPMLFFTVRGRTL